MIVLFLLSSLAVGSSGLQYKLFDSELGVNPLVRVYQLSQSTALSSNVPDSCTSRPFECKGCNMTRTCRPQGGGWVEISARPCPAERPYCQKSTGSCTAANTDPACGDYDDFVCLRDGYFPDPTSNSVYHVCTDGKPLKYKCSSYYHPGLTSCTTDYQYSFAGCTSDGMMVPHQSSSKYYGFCENRKVVFVDRCPDHYLFQQRQQRCVAQCLANGLKIRDMYSSDCSYFYRCGLNPFTSLLELTREKCPEGQIFLQSLNSCVTGKPSSTCSDY